MTLLANRLRSLKGVLIFSMIVLSVVFIMLPFLQGNMVYVLLAASGFLRGGIPAFFKYPYLSRLKE